MLLGETVLTDQVTNDKRQHSVPSGPNSFPTSVPSGPSVPSVPGVPSGPSGPSSDPSSGPSSGPSVPSVPKRFCFLVAQVACPFE